MTVLKIKEDIEEILEQDPYDLFTVEEDTVKPRKWMDFGVAAIVGAMVATLVTFAILYERSDSTESSSPYAYIAVTAIGPDGRTVAGARVKQDDTHVGITDSFGEWRKFMRVKLGSTLSFTIAKASSDGAISGVKTIAIPSEIPANGELEVSARVGLQNLEEIPVTEPMPGEQVSFKEDLEQPLGEISEVAVVRTHDYGPVGVPQALIDSMWLMVDGRFAEPGSRSQSVDLNKQVLPALRKRVRELGIAVDPQSTWRMSLRHLDVKDGDGLIQVIFTRHEHSGDEGVQEFSFLSNYRQSAELTARRILFKLSMHKRTEYMVEQNNDGVWGFHQPTSPLWRKGPGVPLYDKSDRPVNVTGALQDFQTVETSEVCEVQSKCVVYYKPIPEAKPKADWVRHTAKVPGGQKRNLGLYVTGYEAEPGGVDTWVFWGPANGSANITIVESGKVVWRDRKALAKGKALQIAVPVAALSRR